MSELDDHIDTSELKTKGLVILRSFFSEEIKQDLADRARTIIALRDAGKLTTYDQDSQGLPDEWFTPLLRNETLVRLMTQVIGPNVCAKGNRILAKDKHFKMGVHVHQDWPYNSGDTRKITVFVPLTRMNKDNGGLIFYEGSHFYGPVSKGPLDVSRFPPMTEICPDIDVGDILVCDYLTWHYSNPSDNGEERIMLQLNYQPADDPSSNNVVAGVRSHDKLLLSRFDAASLPSVELNCKVAREFYEAGDLDRASRYAQGLLYDDADHSSAALLLCDILADKNDPSALRYLEQARASIRKQMEKISAYDRRYGLDPDPIVGTAPSGAQSSQADTASPWRPLPTTWRGKAPGQADVEGLPANLVTPEPAWAYGAVSDPLQTSSPATVRIRARTTKGKIGFCMIRADDGSLASEQHLVTPESNGGPVMIAFTPEMSPAQLVVRNWDVNTAGEVTVESIDILEYS